MFNWFKRKRRKTAPANLNDYKRLMQLIDGYIRECDVSDSFITANNKLPKEIISIIALFYPRKFGFHAETENLNALDEIRWVLKRSAIYYGKYYKHPIFKVAADGLSFSNPEHWSGTILFGPFFGQEEKVIYTASFQGLYKGYWGIGFATSTFVQFCHWGDKCNEPNARIIYVRGGKSQNCMYEDGQWPGEYFQEIWSFDAGKSRAFDENDIVCIEVNMVTKVGRIYNKLYPDEPTALIDLHCKHGIAIAISNAINPSRYESTVRCVEQKFGLRKDHPLYHCVESYFFSGEGEKLNQEN